MSRKDNNKSVVLPASLIKGSQKGSRNNNGDRDHHHRQQRPPKPPQLMINSVSDNVFQVMPLQPLSLSFFLFITQCMSYLLKLKTKNTIFFTHDTHFGFFF